MKVVNRLRQWRDVFYGWRVIAVAAGLRALGGGLHLQGLSIFFLPIARDLNLSRAVTSLIFSVSRAEGAVIAPISGHFIDRFGPKVVMLVGCIVVGTGYLLLSQANSFLSILLIYVVIISLGFGASFMQAPMALANNWFAHRRATAMSVLSASIALGGTVLTPLLAITVHSLGWRWGAILAGILFLAIGLPLARLVRNTPESMGLSPLGQKVQVPPATNLSLPAKNGREEGGYSVGEALRTVTYWVMVLGNLLQMAAFAGVMVHFVPLLVWKGLEEQTAAFYLAAFAFLAMPMSLLTGWLADRWSKPRILSIGALLGMIGLLSLLYGGTVGLLIFIPLFVVIEAMHPVTAATLGDYFGRRQFATLRGLLTTFTILGPMSGPLIAGRVYDVTKSYTLVLEVFIIALALSSLSFWFLHRPKKRLVMRQEKGAT